MPCLEAPCPCWSSSDLEAFYNAGKVSCVRGVSGSEDCFSIELSIINDKEKVPARIVDNTRSGLGYCQFNGNPRVKFENIDQQNACKSMLEDIIATRGLLCKKKTLECIKK